MRWSITRSPACDVTSTATSRAARAPQALPTPTVDDSVVPTSTRTWRGATPRCQTTHTSWIQHAIDLLTADTPIRKHGLPILDVALAVGRSETDIRELVKPQGRSAGFTRPEFLEYADKAKRKVKAIGCPHDRCKGRRFADHVALLPEVAASGYGIICRSCRRTPETGDDWSRTQFPMTYLSSWTNRGSSGSLRQEGQTISGPLH